MCGIVGFNGNNQAAPVLLDGLSKLEYRGYDSAGIAVFDGSTTVEAKAKGRLAELCAKTDDGKSILGTCGIGHTRWATHGEPTEINAHPHHSDDMQVVAVHNGIIENYQELKSKLIKKGYTFYSQTDTEVVTKLIDYYYKKYKVGPIDALAKTMVRVRGTYALVVMYKDYPGEIYVARKDSPMILGISEGESYIASDVPAILKYTRNVYYIDNLEMARVKKGEIDFYNLDGEIVHKETKEIKWNAEAAEKGGYEHFMLKEIHEQSRVVKDTINSVLVDGIVDLSRIDISTEELKGYSQVYIVACGSSYHVGMALQYVIEALVRVPVRVELASEFKYRNPILDKDGIVIFISQSGETADTKDALMDVKRQGITTLAIVNVVGSSLAREADKVFYTVAGPEIAVATTKAYSAQLVAGYLFAIAMGRAKGAINNEKYNYLIKQLNLIPDKIEEVFNLNAKLQWLANEFTNTQDVFFIGRGIDYAVCLEGSLKLKEISYIHSEAYAAGELKHGTISLIENGTVVISLLTQEALYEKTVSNLVEVKSRGANTIAFTAFGYEKLARDTMCSFDLPKVDELFMGSIAVVPLQILSYYVSVGRGLDVDKPRNLAKSVTVE